MAFAQHSSRPIAGAVATLGVSERVAFMRRTYAHLGAATLLWALATGLFMQTDASLAYVRWTGQGWNFFLVFFGFLGAGYAAQAMATSQTSRVIQYLGLGLEIAAFTLLTQPVLWVAFYRTGGNQAAFENLVLTAALITGVIFGGLTATVFITKKDFSFLRGALAIGMFAVIGVALAGALFGFTLGALFSAAVILLMAGYILYETSLVMAHFPPGYHVAAALMLFASVATLFIHVLNLLSRLRE